MNPKIANETFAEAAETSAPLAIADPETAKIELARFAHNCGIRLVTQDKTTDKTERAYYERVLGYIMSGELVVNNDGTGTYTLKKPVTGLKSVTFDEPDGIGMRALDVMEKQGNQTGMQAFIASFAKQSIAVVGKVKKRDLDPLGDIALLFLG